MADGDATTPSTFTHFSRLPPELRTIIWRQALPSIPDKNASVPYPYKKGCWHAHDAEPFDEDDPLPNIYVEFLHEQIDHAEAELSLLLVSQEAHAVAATWISESKAAGKPEIEIRYRDDTQRHVITRPFDPDRDIMYFLPERLADLEREPDNDVIDLDVLDVYITTGSPITTMAISETLFRDDFPVIMDKISQWFLNTHKFLLVTNSDKDGLDDALRSGEFRTLKEVPGGLGFYWDGERLDALSPSGERIGEDHLPESAWNLTEKLWDVFTSYDVSHFEIKLAYAV